MATKRKFKMSISQRRARYFSENFKIQKVREIESGRTRVIEVCKQYEVSDTSVYKWLQKFGNMKDKPEKLIVESKSDTVELLELKKKVAELERIIGQKQILIDFKEKMIELAEEHYGVDIKKKFPSSPSSTSGKIGKK